jgi:pimeloyl-ACP methyl ester carboxylesterase
MMNSMDNQLRNLQVEYKDKTYKLSVRLRPDSSDSNGLIVFIHGWGGAKECFTDAFSSDALGDYGICTIDLLGFGKSEKPEDFSYDLLDQANIVALAVNSLGAAKVYIVGHSMGGGIGLLAAPQIQNLAMFINAEGNLAPVGSATDARIAAKQSFRQFTSFTLPLLIILLRFHPRRSMRIWAQWFSEASPLALHRSIQSLVRWSDSRKLFPLFESLPRKAYVYGANGKRKKDIVPRLSKSIAYEVLSSGHPLMNHNPKGFYAIVAKIIHDAQPI